MVEYIYNGVWRAADPTLLTKVDYTYIPLGVLENEGLDFKMGLLSIMERYPYRIEVSGL